MWIIVIAILWMLICYKLASDKGRDKWLAVLSGFIFGFIAVLYYLFVSPIACCLICKKTIPKEAIICPFCQSKRSKKMVK